MISLNQKLYFFNFLRAPSFFCENETRHGLTLHYRTRRKGFVSDLITKDVLPQNIYILI